MSNIIDYILINGAINIVVEADKENVLLWGDEPIPCYEVQDISFEMEDNNKGSVGSSFFTSCYDMFEKASLEQIETVDNFLKEISER
jgi:hypothetical protein